MQYFAGLSCHSTPDACLLDTTIPVFAGISSLVANANGSLTATWLAGSDATLPLYYDVFIQAGSSTGLFADANLATSTKGLSRILFSDALGVPLAKNVTYFVGVRARDAVGNIENNIVSASVQSQGVPDNSIFNLIAELAKTTCSEFVAVSETETFLATKEADTEFVAMLECD